MEASVIPIWNVLILEYQCCLLYTSDAADERSSVDLGGRRIIKKKNTHDAGGLHARLPILSEIESLVCRTTKSPRIKITSEW